MLEHEQKNVWKMIGMRIRRERIKRNWSQSGLCYGICAVSYLSKIEQGKMEVSEEILKLLLERLELPWIDDKETKDLESFVEAQYEFLFTHPNPLSMKFIFSCSAAFLSHISREKGKVVFRFVDRRCLHFGSSI